MSVETTYEKSSGEKAARARAGTQIALWNEAMSWLGPLREYARISTAVRPALRVGPALRSGTDDSLRSSEQRLLFLGWEVDALITKNRGDFDSAHELIAHLVFKLLGFTICDDAELRKLEGSAAILDHVLARRSGPAGLISLLYCWLSEKVTLAYESKCDFVRIEPVTGTPTSIVRLIPKNDCGTVWLIDLSRGAARVEQAVWCHWCINSNVDGFARLSFAQGLVRSLTEMFRQFEKVDHLTLDVLSAQLFILDQIISLQPSETSRWAERAMLNTRRGDRSSALDDLKRFFAFHERESAPSAIVSLFDDLRRSENLESDRL